MLGDQWTTQRVNLEALSIGPITSQALRDLGVETITEAESPSAEGLVIALVGAASG